MGSNPAETYSVIFKQVGKFGFHTDVSEGFIGETLALFSETVNNSGCIFKHPFSKWSLHSTSVFWKAVTFSLFAEASTSPWRDTSSGFIYFFWICLPSCKLLTATCHQRKGQQICNAYFFYTKRQKIIKIKQKPRKKECLKFDNSFKHSVAR